MGLVGMYCTESAVGISRNENEVPNTTCSTPLGRLVSHEQKRPTMESAYHNLALRGAVATPQLHKFSTTEFFGWMKVLNVLSWSNDDHTLETGQFTQILLLRLLINSYSL